MAARQKAVVAAGVVDAGLVAWRQVSQGPFPSRLPAPGKFPLILMIYAVLWLVSESETLGAAAAVVAWGLVAANLMHVGNIDKLLTDMGQPGKTKTVPNVKKG